ncbi:MAG: NfeD family protein [Ignavibacteriae bacterium]|nr:NfeD family protein [Ignavibacteriota bacterium]
MELFSEGFSALVWFIVGVVFFLAEMIVPGFIIFFFGIGAWVAAIAALFGLDNLTIQLLIFVVVSVLSLILFRKKGKSIFKGKEKAFQSKDDDKLDEFIEDIQGKKATVISDIIPGEISGKVEFRGTQWKADADEIIKTGTVVEIIKRDNITLKVKTVKNDN